VEEPEAPGPGGLDLDTGLVRAAGGIVSRHDSSGQLEVLLVHRPAYDDWAFPKGKHEPGESDEACALREVEEETGLRCAIERLLGESRYIDAKGRPKLVRYFAMKPLDGRFTPHAEIDDARWLGVDDALAALSYERDRELLTSFAAQAG
jgi:8-oxo-dGTP diphosphatase